MRYWPLRACACSCAVCAATFAAVICAWLTVSVVGVTTVTVDVSRGADLFICECNFFDRRAPGHLDYTTITEKRSQLACERLVLTHMGDDVLRIVLVDTFKDEAEESLRVAEALGKRLRGVRLDTPGERGGVTVDLVKEVRARLDLAGFANEDVFAHS